MPFLNPVFSSTETSYSSAGTVTKPTKTYLAGGSAIIGNGTYRLYPNSTYDGVPIEYAISGSTFYTTDSVTTYFIAKYNSGSPILTKTENLADINDSDVIPVFTFARYGDIAGFIDWDEAGKGLPNKLHFRIIRTQRFQRATGIDLSVSGSSRIITISAGAAYQGVYYNSLDQVASGSDTAILVYTTGSPNSWLTGSFIQYPNTQYDSGSGFATLTDGRYALTWVYRSMGGVSKMYAFLGSGNYTLDEAKVAQPPAVPQIIATNTMLTGKIITLKGADTPTQIDSAYSYVFSTTTPVRGKDWCVVKHTSGSVITSGSVDLTFNTVYGNMVTSSPYITLSGGRIYNVTFHAGRWTGTNTAEACSFYDNTNTRINTASLGTMIPTNTVTTWNGSGASFAVIAPATDTQVKIRLIGTGITLDGGSWEILVTEL